MYAFSTTGLVWQGGMTASRVASASPGHLQPVWARQRGGGGMCSESHRLSAQCEEQQRSSWRRAIKQRQACVNSAHGPLPLHCVPSMECTACTTGTDITLTHKSWTIKLTFKTHISFSGLFLKDTFWCLTFQFECLLYSHTATHHYFVKLRPKYHSNCSKTLSTTVLFWIFVTYWIEHILLRRLCACLS